jgi:hypothetical protein
MDYPVKVQIGSYMLEGAIPEEFVEICFECERPILDWPNNSICYNCKAQDFAHD